MDALLPFPTLAEQQFDPMAPSLKNMSVESVTVAKVCHLLITAVIGKLLSKAEEGEATLRTLVADLLKRLASCPPFQDHIVKAALADVSAACSAVDSLLNPRAKSASSSLQELANASKGPLYIMRQTLRNIPHYKRLQAELERTALASSSLLPLLDELVAKVTAGDESKIKEALAELPGFRSSLREGATTPLELALVKWARGKLTEDTSDIAAVEAAVAHAMTVKACLCSLKRGRDQT